MDLIPVAKHVTTMIISRSLKNRIAALAKLKAVAADPSNAAARIALAAALDDAEQSSGSSGTSRVRPSLRLRMAQLTYKLGMLLFKQKKLERAIEEALSGRGLRAGEYACPFASVSFVVLSQRKILSMRRARHWRFRRMMPRSII